MQLDALPLTTLTLIGALLSPVSTALATGTPAPANCPATATTEAFVGSPGVRDFADGVGQEALLENYLLLAEDDDYVYVADAVNRRIRRLNPLTGELETIAGTGATGYVDGPGDQAQFSFIGGIAVDGNTLYVSDAGNHRIRSIDLGSPDFYVSTVAGSGVNRSRDGYGLQASFSALAELTVLNGLVYVLDTNEGFRNGRWRSYGAVLRSFDPATGEVKTVAGNIWRRGKVNGPGLQARFRSPRYLSNDGLGTVFISETNGYSLRSYDVTTGQVSFLAGRGRKGYVDGPADVAKLRRPRGLATDGLHVYFVEFNSHTLRRVDLSDGRVETVAGKAKTMGYANGTGSEARFQRPLGLTYHAATDSLFVSDLNAVIRRIDLGQLSDGDADGDGVCDALDVCPGFDDNINSDGDDLADGCDPCPDDTLNDADFDGVCFSVDTCAGADDALDFDEDGLADDCDDDIDGDGVENEFDVAIYDPNIGQLDGETLDAAEDGLTVEDARHLYRRAGFGGTSAEIDAAVANGLSWTLDQMLTPTDTPEIDSTMVDLMYPEEIVNGPNPMSKSQQRTGAAWTYRLCASPNQLEAKMFFFFHDLYAAAPRNSATNVVDIDNHASTLLEHALGNARDLAVDMTLDPLMLEWLDNDSNCNPDVNENYAREFWELFTLGTGNYSEADVNESARAFSGYLAWQDVTSSQGGSSMGDMMESSSTATGEHDGGVKTLFEGSAWEQTGNFDGYDVVDLTFAHPAAAEHLARQLLRFFVVPEPALDHVDELAAVIEYEDFEMVPVLHYILSSQLFFSPAARKSGIKTPLEHNLGLLRSFDLVCTGQSYPVTLASGETHMSSAQAARVWRLSGDQGMRLLSPPSVKGWDDDEYWLHDSWLLDRMNTADRLLRHNKGFEGFEYADLMPHPEASAVELMEHLADVMGIALSNDDRVRMLGYLNTRRDHSGNEYAAAFDPTDEQLVGLKVWGLVLLFSQHPDYQLH